MKLTLHEVFVPPCCSVAEDGNSADAEHELGGCWLVGCPVKHTCCVLRRIGVLQCPILECHNSNLNLRIGAVKCRDWWEQCKGSDFGARKDSRDLSDWATDLLPSLLPTLPASF